MASPRGGKINLTVTPRTRRQFLGLSAAVGGATLLGACGTSDKPSTGSGSTKGGNAGKVIVRTAGGSYEEGWKKACFEPFQKETGIEIVTSADPVEKIAAAHKAGNVQVDVLQLGVRQLEILRTTDALAPVDYSKFTWTKPDDLRMTEDFYAGTIAWASVIAYNSDTFKDGPKSWADVWNTQAFKGRRTFTDASSGLLELEAPLLADGVDIKSLYPLDLDRAFRKLKELKPSVVKFFGSGDEQVQLYQTKAAVLGLGWNGRIQVLQNGGAPMAIEWNQNIQSVDGLGIAAGAPNAANALKLVDYSLRPDVLAKLAEYTGYSPLCDASYKLVPDTVLKNLPSTPERAALGVVRDVKWWVANQAEVDKRWQEFLVS